MSITETIKRNYPRIIALVVALLLLGIAVSCVPKVRSPWDPEQRLTRTELGAEMEFMIRMYEVRTAQLAEKERFRELILSNALAISQGGNINPFSIITTIAAFYGLGTAANDTRKLIKKPKAT